jgi:4-aminobutyrate aminotransferase-like enzyme
MMLGIPLLDEHGSAAPGAGVQAMFDLLEEGVMVSPGGTAGEVVSLAPAFNIDRTQLEVAVERLCAWLERYDER